MLTTTSSARRGPIDRAQGVGRGSCGRLPLSTLWARSIGPLRLAIASLGCMALHKWYAHPKKPPGGKCIGGACPRQGIFYY